MGTTETKKMRVGVVGCGAISDIYLTNMIHNFENLEVAACCAGHLEHAKKKAEQYGIKGCTYEEILADPSIEMVVILTPAPTHEGLIRQALEAGKHVYTEKTMTLAPETAAKTDRAGRGETSLSRFRTGHLPWIGTADRKKSDRRRADRRGDIFRSMRKPRS